MIIKKRTVVIAAGSIAALLAAAFGQQQTSTVPVATTTPVPTPPVTSLPSPTVTKWIKVLGPVRTKILTKIIRVPGPVRTVKVPGPERIVRVPGPTRTITKYVSRSKPRQALPQQQGTKKQRLVTFGRWLQARNFRVGEHSLFGGVASVHTAGSAHYTDDAIDVNKDNGNEFGEIQGILEEIRARGFRSIWRYPGHFGHVHIDTRPGPDLGQR